MPTPDTTTPRRVRFDHTIVPARDRRESATFFADLFGLPEPEEAGPFLQVHLDGATVDFAEPPIDFPGHHYAFLVDDDTFDRVLDRLRADGIAYWADPQQRRPGEMNTNHGGRGVYFDDPSGHHLEAMTVRYDGTRWYETW
jgi:catechol 2,3-dioxygenase-like lactoylglutathione lyase family enzyme